MSDHATRDLHRQGRRRDRHEVRAPLLRQLRRRHEHPRGGGPPPLGEGHRRQRHHRRAARDLSHPRGVRLGHRRNLRLRRPPRERGRRDHPHGLRGHGPGRGARLQGPQGHQAPARQQAALIGPVPSVLNPMRAGLLALLLLASCAPRSGGPATTGEVAAGGLQIRSGLDPASPDPIEGGLGLFSVSVRNGSKKCVILRDLTLVDGTPILTWVNPPPRPLEYDRGSDEFRSEVGPRSAGEVVHIGMLLPGESVIFRPQVRLLNLPRRYLLNYYSYSADQVSQNVYFEVLGPGQLRYRRLPIADVTAIPIM